MRDDESVGQLLPFDNMIPFLDDQVFSKRDEVFLFHARVFIAHDDDPLVLLDAAEVDHSVDLGDLGRIFWSASFEELGDAWKTARNILRLDRAAWQTSEEHTRFDKLSFVYRDEGPDWNRIGTDELCILGVGINGDLRVELAAVLFHDQLGLARLLVDFALG